MVALPLYTLVILRLSPHKDDGAPLNVRWVLRVQTRRSSPQQAGDRKLRNQAPRKPTPSYISSHLNPNSNGFLVSSALYRLCRTNLSVGGGGRAMSNNSVCSQSTCLSKAMLIHLIQRTGCFQACGVERKRFM